MTLNRHTVFQAAVRASIIALLCFLVPLSRAQEEKDLLIGQEQKRHALLRQAGTGSAASADIDVTYYFLDLLVSTPPAPTLLSGTVTMRALARSDSLAVVVLDLMNSLSVDSVTSGGSRVPFAQQPSTLTVQLDRTYKRDEPFTVAVTYHGIPAATGFGSFYFAEHEGVPWVWTLSQPYGSRDWWPCKDHPLDKADSADIWITCDGRFRAGSNGTLRAVIGNPDGTKTWRWAERYPIASYLISMAITNYAELVDYFRYTPTDSMPVLHYVLPELIENARPDLARTVGMLGIFSEAYGLYPFIREKYGHASTGRGGAMEHQTMTSTTTFAEYVVAHELAHQWFGDMITCRTWTDLWLNEGFATYSEALYAERRYGPEMYKGYMRTAMESAKKSPDPLRARDTSDIGRLFAKSGVYDKGASLLHMLRRVLSDSVFFRAIRAYAEDPAVKYGTASTTDFRRACERAAGRDLGQFFDQWTDGRGYPSYSYAWSAKAEAGMWEVALHLDQTNGIGAPTFFLMPLEVRLSGEGWDTTVTVLNSAASQDFMLRTRLKPLTLRLDTDGWVLADRTNRNEIAVLPAEFRLYPNFPNPFNPGTTIPFDLPHRSHVTLTIHNILGEEVARLVDERREAGRQEVLWHGRTSSGAHSPSGVYFYYLQTDEGLKSGRMVLAR